MFMEIIILTGHEEGTPLKLQLETLTLQTLNRLELVMEHSNV